MIVKRLALIFVLVAGCTTPNATSSSSPDSTASAGATTQMTPEDLAARQWENRLLVVFADEEADLRLEAQRREMGVHVAAMKERDVVLVEVVGEDALRETLGVEKTGFHVVLVGKDGGVKLRSDAPVAGTRVIMLIDAMPMGEQELRKRTSPQ